MVCRCAPTHQSIGPTSHCVSRAVLVTTIGPCRETHRQRCLKCGGQPAMRVASAQIAAMEPRRIMMMLRISGGRSGTMPSASGGGGRNRANVVPTASAPPMASNNHGRRFSPRNTLLRLLADLMVARRKLLANVGTQHGPSLATLTSDKCLFPSSRAPPRRSTRSREWSENVKDPAV